MLRNARSQLKQNLCRENHFQTQNFQASPKTEGKKTKLVGSSECEFDLKRQTERSTHVTLLVVCHF